MNVDDMRAIEMEVMPEKEDVQMVAEVNTISVQALDRDNDDWF